MSFTNIAGDSRLLPGPEALPRTTRWRYSDLRLCITSFALALSFLVTASAHLGHFHFQILCMTYLLKSYFLTLLLALGGLTMLAGVAYFLRRESDKDLARRYKLIAFFVPAMMLVNLAYFSLKAGSAAFNTNMGLIVHERVLWDALRPLFANLPSWGYYFLDFTYMRLWFVSLSALPLSLVFMDTSRAIRLNCAVMLLLAFTALGNVVLLTYSPVYEFPAYFSYLPASLQTWKIHQASLSLTHNLINLKSALFSSPNAGFFQPVAAFPAFHTSYAFLLLLAFRHRRYIKVAMLAFFIAVVTGGLILGYHGFVDTSVAVAAAAVIFLPMP